MPQANSLGEAAAGIQTFDGTSTYTGSTVTEFATVIGGANNTVSSVGPGDAGEVLTSNGAGAAPTFQATAGGTQIGNMTYFATGGTTGTSYVDASYLICDGSTYDVANFPTLYDRLGQLSPGTNWGPVSSGTGSVLRGATFGDDIFVLCGDSGVIRTSTDGITWGSESSGTGSGLNRVRFVNDLFIAVGQSGTIRTSTDTITWNGQTSGTNEDLRDVTFGNSLYVIVGEGGTILSSTDAVTWDPESSGTTNDLTGITFALSLYVAAGSPGRIFTSTNASTWTQQTIDAIASLGGITFGADLFVAAGRDGGMRVSTDGVDWQSITAGSRTFQDVIFAENLFVAVATNSELRTSTNGLSWPLRYSGSTSGAFFGAAGGNSIYVCGGADGEAGRSPDETRFNVPQINKDVPILFPTNQLENFDLFIKATE